MTRTVTVRSYTVLALPAQLLDDGATKNEKNKQKLHIISNF
jgi:hypothetical protein